MLRDLDQFAVELILRINSGITNNNQPTKYLIHNYKRHWDINSFVSWVVNEWENEFLSEEERFGYHPCDSKRPRIPYSDIEIENALLNAFKEIVTEVHDFRGDHLPLVKVDQALPIRYTFSKWLTDNTEALQEENKYHYGEDWVDLRVLIRTHILRLKPNRYFRNTSEAKVTFEHLFKQMGDVVIGDGRNQLPARVCDHTKLEKVRKIK